jgi:hypothetical protein
MGTPGPGRTAPDPPQRSRTNRQIQGAKEVTSKPDYRGTIWPDINKSALLGCFPKPRISNDRIVLAIWGQALTNPSELRDVHDISETDKAAIKAFLQGAVYAWINTREDKHEWFAVRDLVGGENWDWKGTPLYALFQKHRNAGKSEAEAYAAAAIDAGWLMKTVLREDKRAFDASKGGLVSTYRWTGDVRDAD